MAFTAFIHVRIFHLSILTSGMTVAALDLIFLNMEPMAELETLFFLAACQDKTRNYHQCY